MYRFEFRGREFEIATREGLFSPGRADRGTLAMLSAAELAPGMKALDLGCGAGIVGIAAASVCGDDCVTMCDIDPNAVACARENAARNGFTIRAVQSDAYDGVDDSGFDAIFTNPPYQSDFAVAKRFIEKGFNRLRLGGRLYMVTKRRPWYENKLKSVFGGCRVYEIDGYFVFVAERRGERYASKK